MQKNSAILLCYTALKYYHKTDRKVFEQMKRTHLTKQWIKSDLETQIKEITAHIKKLGRNYKFA
jgi:hypothetical protein